MIYNMGQGGSPVESDGWYEFSGSKGTGTNDFWVDTGSLDLSKDYFIEIFMLNNEGNTKNWYFVPTQITQYYDSIKIVFGNETTDYEFTVKVRLKECLSM